MIRQGNRWPKQVERILFLARFAPLDESIKPSFDDVWGNSPFYHDRLYRALKTTGVAIIPSRNPLDVIEKPHCCDFVYSIYNRANFRNSEVFVSSLCEYAGLPYLGGPPNIRAIAEDKHLAKTIACRLGIPTPEWVKVESWQSLDTTRFPRFPCIVKWRFGADSAELTPDCIVSNEIEARRKTHAFQERDIPVIIETFVPGLNLTTAAIGGQDCSIFDTVRIDTDAEGNIQTYEQKKFERGRRTKSIFRDQRICSVAEGYIRLLYEYLGTLDYFRCDFRLNPATDEIFFLECNAVCNIAEESSFFTSCKAQFGDYDKLIRAILEVSLHRQFLFLK